ncbi:MAG: TIGR02099 family protein [Methylococcales bacterium]|nr:TIGR02099 family protein [Methylococcales bacterium]
MIHHIKRATRHLIFWSLIASAVGLLAVRLLLAGLDHYKLELAAEISKQVEAPVTIGHLKTHFHHVSPQLVLDDIAIATPTNNTESPPIQLQEMRIGISLIDLVMSRDVLASTRITLVGAKLTVKKQADGSIAIVGLKAGSGQPLWLLQGRKYQVLNSTLTWQDEQKKGKPLVFDDVNIMIRNKDDHHRVNVLINLDKKQGESLSASLDIKGNIFEPLAINGSGFIEGKGLNLPEWTPLELPLTMSIKSGNGDFKVWATWQNSRLVSMIADVQAKKLQLSRQHKPDFISHHFSSLLFWEKTNDQWRVDVEQFLLESADKKYPATSFIVSGDSDEHQQLHKIKLSMPKVDVHQVASLAAFFAPLPDEQAKLLTQAQPKGTLENFTVSANFDANQFAIASKFTHLSFAPILSLPAVENLTGRLVGDNQSGLIRLKTTNAQFKYPTLFRNIIPINTLQGTLTWQQTADNWTVASSMLEVNSPDIHSKSRLQLVIPKTNQPIFMDLQSAFFGNDISKVVAYYPTSIMSNALVDWLDHAFISGKVPNGGLLFYGNLNDFPFTKGQGVFQVLFSAEQVEVNYHSNWPHLTGLAGEVLFFQDSWQVNIAQGKSDKITLKQAVIKNPSLAKSDRLLVDGEFTAGVADTLDFLQKTPLDLPINAVLDAITPQGNTQVKLALTIPLENSLVPAKVTGTANTSDTLLMVKSVNLLVDKLVGELKFNEQGIYTDRLNAVTLGNPVKIAIKTDEQKTTINVAGRAGINELREQFKMSGWSMAQGASDYKLQLKLPYGNTPSELTIQSLLVGISLDLPDSLAKTSSQQRPLSLTFSLVDKPLLPISLNYDNKLKAELNFDNKQKIIQAGSVLIGTGNVGIVPKAGLKLAINSEQLALQNWLGIGYSLAKHDPVAATPTTTPINEINIHSDSALWKKTPLGLFDLNLKPNGKQWIGSLNSQFATGKLNIPFDLTGENRIVLTMDELDFSLAKQLGNQDSTEAPSLTAAAMPLLTLTSQKTRWQEFELGQLKLVTERTSNGIAFKNVALNSDLQKLTLSGDWQVNGKQSITRARGRLELPRADEFFKRLDISKNFTQTSGGIDFDVKWQGAPQQFSLARLQGSLDVDLTEGRLLGIEPGFGRILGVLAVAQWIKRLQLDFSDVYQEGLTFDSITGHCDLIQGKARTSNLIVDAIPAKITLTGDTDFLRHTVNYTVMVAPKSADAVPIAGTIMGKVASLIGKSLTGKDQDGFFFGSQYLVTGKWGNVQVIPSHENDGLLQKTWKGLTDFSWLNQHKE